MVRQDNSHPDLAQRLFLNNQKLVPWVIGTIFPNLDANTTDELMQEGSIGLWDAALHYNV